MEIGTGKVESIGNDTTATSAGTACVACYRPIRPTARLCPTCRSSQRFGGLVVIADSAKWIGGIAALLSLVVTAWQLVEFTSAIQQNSKVAQVLIDGAAFQRDTRDRKDAIKLIDEALAIDPTASNVYDAKLDWALAQIRYTLYADAERLADLQTAHAIVQQGTFHSDQTKKADAIAHLGWYHHLRCMAKECANSNNQRENARLIQALFEDSLQLDPDNPFAHSFWASWCLKDVCKDEVALATEHFLTALKTGRAREEVYRRIIVYLGGRDLTTRWPNFFSFWDNLQSSPAFTQAQKEKFAAEIGEIIAWEEKFLKIKEHPDNHLFAKVLTWLVEDQQMKGWIERRGKVFPKRFWKARLADLNADVDGALHLYRQARIDPAKRSGREAQTSHTTEEMNKAMRRLLHIGPGWLGVEWENFEATRDLGLGDYPVKQIRRVDPGGPAAQAGLQPGEFITEVEGAPIDTLRALYILETKQAGEIVELSVWRRNKQKVTKALRLAEWPAGKGYRSGAYVQWFRDIALDQYIYGSSVRVLLGQDVCIADLTSVLRTDFGIPDHVSGAIVVSMESLGRSRYTLAPGDIIVGIGEHSVSEAQDVINEMKDSGNRQDKIAMTRYRDGKLDWVTWKR